MIRGVGRRFGVAAASMMAWLGAGAPSEAATRPGDLCWAAVDRAAAQVGAPQPLLRAIALVESGRGAGDAYAPWPWTVNLEGESHYFDNRAEAEAFVRRALADGKTSFDVGCMQINHRWHAPAFASLEAMFDPEANADYAARFLTELREETGDWMTAAGYYHSRTPKFFERYRRRVVRVLANLPGAGATAVAEITAPPPLAQAAPEPETVAAATPPTPRRLNPLRPSAWRGMLRLARGALVGGEPATPEQPAAAGPAPSAPARRAAREASADRRASSAAALWAGALDAPAAGGVRLSMWETARRGDLLARGPATGPDRATDR